MTEGGKIDVPQPVSIQTGNGGLKRLIPLHEDLNDDADKYMLNSHAQEEPNHIDHGPYTQQSVQEYVEPQNECFSPPPLPNEEFEEISNVTNLSLIHI